MCVCVHVCVDGQPMEDNLQCGHRAHYTAYILHWVSTRPVFKSTKERVIKAAKREFTAGRHGWTEEAGKIRESVYIKKWKKRVQKKSERIGISW